MHKLYNKVQHLHKLSRKKKRGGRGESCSLMLWATMTMIYDSHKFSLCNNNKCSIYEAGRMFSSSLYNNNFSSLLNNKCKTGSMLHKCSRRRNNKFRQSHNIYEADRMFSSLCNNNKFISQSHNIYEADRMLHKCSLSRKKKGGRGGRCSLILWAVMMKNLCHTHKLNPHHKKKIRRDGFGEVPMKHSILDLLFIKTTICPYTTPLHESPGL